ncbi:chloride channel protein, partial [Nakamurella sp.]|uniref:chloride channel protein n=1 Tax=Nakamurella sp. TaxID=1869182 RepID=UPI003B3AB8AE
LLADRWGLGPGDRRVAIAAGAGAGLAAVYNVPLAGVVFAVLSLGAGRPAPAPRGGRARGRAIDRVRTVARAALPALRARDWLVVLVACGVATVTAWTVLGSGRVYVLPGGALDQGPPIALVVWAVVAAPVAGVAAVALDTVARRAMARSPAGPVRTPLATTGAMALVGLAAVWWPTLPGNGKGVIELTLGPPAAVRDGALLAGAAPAGWTAAAAFVLLAGLKIALTGVCLRAGIVGGLLTPALAVGSALGAAAAVAATAAGVPASVPEWALIGAAGVLAVSHRSAVFAAVMVWELTGLPWPVVALAAGTGGLARLGVRFGARAAGRG